MPTQSAILEELAVRYGGCDPGSLDDVARFYEQRFGKLSRRQRDRISFEILQRDGEAAPGAPLTPAEVNRLDELFENEEADANQGEPNTAIAGIRRLTLGQAGFSIAVFGAVGSVHLLPDLIPGAVHHLLHVAEAALVAVGLIGNGIALYFDYRVPVRRHAERSYKAKSE